MRNGRIHAWDEVDDGWQAAFTSKARVHTQDLCIIRAGTPPQQALDGGAGTGAAVWLV